MPRPPCRTARLARESLELLDPSLTRTRQWTARELAELPEVRSLEEHYVAAWQVEYDAPDADGYWGHRHVRGYVTRTWRGTTPRRRERQDEADDREWKRLDAAVEARLRRDVGQDPEVCVGVKGSSEWTGADCELLDSVMLPSSNASGYYLTVDEVIARLRAEGAEILRCLVGHSGTGVSSVVVTVYGRGTVSACGSTLSAALAVVLGEVSGSAEHRAVAASLLLSRLAEVEVHA